MENIPSSHSIQEKREDTQLSDFITSLAILEHNPRQLYTNPILAQIKINSSNFTSLGTEVSNFKFHTINSSVIDFVNNSVNYLKPIYIFNNQSEIIKYLNEKKHLIPLLIDASQKIKKVFTNEKLQLRIVHDPEIKYSKKLTIDIHTSLDGDEAFDKLKILDNTWWLDISPLRYNDLEININFDEI